MAMSIKVASIGGVSGRGKAAALGVSTSPGCARAGGVGRVPCADRDGSHAESPEPEFTNQSPPYEDVDLFGSDQPLRDAVAAKRRGRRREALSAFGRRWGAAEMFERGRQANAHPPRLERSMPADSAATPSSSIRPITTCMAESVAEGLACTRPGRADATPAPAPAQVMRAARFYMAAQVETGHLCPITMTRAAVAALAAEPALAARSSPRSSGATTTSASSRGGRRRASRSAWA